MHFESIWTENNYSSEHLLFEKCLNNNRISFHILIRAGGKIENTKSSHVEYYIVVYYIIETKSTNPRCTYIELPEKAS